MIKKIDVSDNHPKISSISIQITRDCQWALPCITHLSLSHIHKSTKHTQQEHRTLAILDSVLLLTFEHVLLLLHFISTNHVYCHHLTCTLPTYPTLHHKNNIQDQPFIFPSSLLPLSSVTRVFHQLILFH